MTVTDDTKSGVQLHQKSPADGDIVLSRLAHMLEGGPSITSDADESIDMPNVDGTDLVDLRRVMDSACSPKFPTLRRELLEFCVKFEMHLVGSAILRATELPYLTIGGWHACAGARSDHLIWASRLDCPDVAHKLYFSLSEKPAVEETMPGNAHFGRAFAERLRPGWVWALQQARYSGAHE